MNYLMFTQVHVESPGAGVLFEMAFLLLVGLSVGFLGQFISGESKGGCPVSVAAALIGAWGGPLVAEWLDYPEPWPFKLFDATFPVATTLAGALIVTLLVNLITRGRRW